MTNDERLVALARMLDDEILAARMRVYALETARDTLLCEWCGDIPVSDHMCPSDELLGLIQERDEHFKRWSHQWLCGDQDAWGDKTNHIRRLYADALEHEQAQCAKEA